MQHLRVIARGYVKIGKEEAARSLFRSMLEPTRAEEGCVFYDYYESVPASGTFFTNEAAPDERMEVYIDELWADQAAQDAHAKTPYFAELKASLAAVIDGDFHVVNLIEVDPAS